MAVRMRIAGKLLLAALSAGLPISASADLVGSINAVRLRGCESRPGVGTPLRVNARLNEAARHLARGSELGEAMRRAGYRAREATSTEITLSAQTREQAVVRALSQHYCAQLTDADFLEIGTAQVGRGTWIVLAAPFSPPSANESESVSQRVLALVNQARWRGRRCGNERFEPALPLVLSPLLTQVALAHARDMAARGQVSHQGRDRSEPADRVTRAGYRWRFVAENVAGGATTAEEVVNNWLESPGHCANIMNQSYTEMGIAFAVNEKSPLGVYWAQVFATPH